MPEGKKRTPIDVEMKYDRYSKDNVDGYPIYLFYIKGSEYKEMPLDANVRLPSEKAIPYKEMVNTLEREPKQFLLRNGGINVIASSVRINKSKNTVRLTFPHGTGIVNGGHTQLALINIMSQRDISDATIQIQVIEHEFSDEELATIAASRNLASNVKPYSTAEKKGYFKKIKDYMIPDFEKHIIWYENRNVPNGVGMNAVDLIARVNLFNCRLYQSSYKNKLTDQPNNSATSKGSVFKKWVDNQQEYEHLYPLINDIINLEEHILTTFQIKAPHGFTTLKVVNNIKDKDKKTIFTGKKKEWEIPTQFLLPIMASFRANIFYHPNKGEIGWHEKPEDLFDRVKTKLLSETSRTYKNHAGEINRLSKDPNYWRILYDTMDREVNKKLKWKIYEIK